MKHSFSRAKLAKFINNALSWKLIVYTLTVLTSILAGLPTAVVKSMSQITTAPAPTCTICQF
jgi:flagellar biosynthesis protein FliQ